MSLSEPTVGDRSTVALVRDLCASLDRERVRYCHFKSNAALDRTRTAQNDLDLLIDRADAEAFGAVLHRLGFKLALVHPTKALPGVVNYYGHDPDAERLVHVHAHYQLVVGDDLTKNYRIPLEEAYLTCAVRDGEFPIPTPELELILLVIRLVLKHATWDAYAARLTRMPPSAREELDFLLARADRGQVNRDLERWLPFVSGELFGQCLQALAPQAGMRERVRAGHRLLEALGPCARRPRAADVGVKLWRRGAGLARRAARRPLPRKRLAAGGAVIAFIGADGAGKSTAIEAVHGWLGQAFGVRHVHLGRPPRTRASSAVRALALAPSVPVAVLRRYTPLVSGPAPERPRQRAVLATALARDRCALARSARRTAANGGLVIADRFPLPQLTIMDAPRVERILGAGAASGLGRRLAAIERRYYRSMIAPDVVIVLLVDPEVAVARKPEEAADFIRERWRAMGDVDWEALPVHVIDAGDPAEEVLARIKSVIWSHV